MSTLIGRLVDPLTRDTIPRWAQFALVIALVAMAGVIRAVIFSGYEGLDDAEYTRFAYLLAHGRPFPADYAGPGVFPLRVGVYVPAAGLMHLLGVSEWTVALYPFLISLAAVALMYIGASFFFGWQAGVIAASLLAVLDLDIENATTLLPDLLSAFFGAVGVMLIARGAGRDAADRGSLLRNGLLAGFAFGLAWLCKESVVYLAPFCLILAAITIKRDWSALTLWVGVAVGSLAVLSTEMATHWAMTGDPLFRLHEVERNYKQWENGFFTAGSILGWSEGVSYRDALIDRLFVSGPRRILLDGALNYVPLVALIGALYGWLKRDRAFLIPALWLISLVLMFNFASSSTSSYIPLPLYLRYMYPMYFAAIILASGFIAKLLFAPPTQAQAGSSGGLFTRAVGLAIAAVVLYSSATNLYFSFARSRVAWIGESRQLHTSVTPKTVVYADTLTLRTFEFFAGYPEQTAWTDFAAVAPGQELPQESLVIVNKRYIQWLDRNAGMWVAWPHPGPTSRTGYRKHDFYEHAPAAWKSIWHNNNTQVFKVSGESASLVTRHETSQGEAR